MNENLNWKQKTFYNIGFIGSAIAALAYGAWGFITLEESGKTILQILGDVGISLAIGFLIVTLLKLQGMIKGRNHDDFRSVWNDFIKALSRAVPFFKWLFRYVKKQNKEAYIIVRTTILSKKGMEYSDYFDKEGRYVGEYEKIDKDDEQSLVKLKKERNKAIKRCLSLNITTLSPSDITADNGKPLDPLNMGRSQEEWFAKTSVIGFMITILMALLFGYFAPVFFDGFDKGELIWKSIQLVAFSISGFIQLYLAFMFITGAYKDRFIKKTNHLDELCILGKEWNIEEGRKQDDIRRLSEDDKQDEPKDLREPSQSNQSEV